MKILLVAINAKYIHSCPAVYSLCASCGYPESVEIAEFTINDRYQDILDGILEREAALIGFSSYIWNTELLLNLVADIRRVRRDAVILFAGGPEASYAPEKFLSYCSHFRTKSPVFAAIGVSS
ncbi:MAG: cobalamin B12-binding domain-containing protein [Lachnospiraceae bacterium]|nr:cobalamin B12-binding domain-containing protein [Lachnospiraceae bacterium]